MLPGIMWYMRYTVRNVVAFVLRWGPFIAKREKNRTKPNQTKPQTFFISFSLNSRHDRHFKQNIRHFSIAYLLLALWNQLYIIIYIYKVNFHCQNKFLQTFSAQSPTYLHTSCYFYQKLNNPCHVRSSIQKYVNT